MRRPWNNTIADKKKKKKKRWNSFFKIITQYIIDNGRFEVPKKIVRMLENELSNIDVATVMVPCGPTWPVDLTKAKGKIWFDDGWLEFMKYYSIDVGYFLAFKYVGNSCFHVTIFDLTACEIDEYPCHTKDLVEFNHEEGVCEIECTCSHTKDLVEFDHEEMVCQTPSTEEIDDSMEVLDVHFPCLTCTKEVVVVDGECESQQTTNTMCLSPVKQLSFSPQHNAALIIEPTSNADLGSYDKNKRSESNPVERDICEIFPFHFKEKPEVVTIDSDSENDADPSMNTQHKSSSNKARGNYYSTRKIYNTRTSKSRLNQSLESVHLNKQKRKRSKTNEVEAHRVNQRTGCHDTGRPYSIAAAVTELKERAIQAAKAFKSENPSCFIIMRPSYLRKGPYVNIPSAFAWTFLTKKTRSFTIRLSNGKTWHVECLVNQKDHSSRLYGSAWTTFIEYNRLKEGDVCVFELVDRLNIVMTVHIFRVFDLK